MSQAPSTLGSMITSSLSPIAATSSVMSSSTQGELSALMRVHSPVEPKSVALAIAMKPSRAAFLASAGIASSRLPSTTSTSRASCGTLAVTFSICGGTKWIMRSSRTGNSRMGAGAPAASGLKKLAWQFHALRIRTRPRSRQAALSGNSRMPGKCGISPTLESFALRNAGSPQSRACPYFGLIFLGYVFGRVKDIPEGGLAWMEFFIVYVALPCLFYRIVAKTPLEELVRVSFRRRRPRFRPRSLSPSRSRSRLPGAAPSRKRRLPGSPAATAISAIWVRGLRCRHSVRRRRRRSR